MITLGSADIRRNWTEAASACAFVRHPTRERRGIRRLTSGIDIVVGRVPPAAFLSAPQRGDLELELARQPDVIGIDERRVFGPRLAQRRIADRSGIAAVCEVDHANSRIARKLVQI